MSYFLSPLLRQRFFDDVTGAPLAGGQLYTYAAGTTTPQSTYVSAAGTVNTNPIILDSNGYCDVWTDPSIAYKFVLEDSLGNVLWTVDNVATPYEINAWSSTISYSQGQIVQDLSGYGLFYVSLTNSNLNNALTSVSNWRRLGGNIRTVSTSQTSPTLLVTDELVRSNSTAGNLIHTLPPCSSTPIGTKIAIKDVGTGGNYTQVKGSGTDSVDGNNTWAINLASYMQAEFENNGTSWDASIGPISTTAIAAQAVTAAKIANATITATQIANATITGTQIAATTVDYPNLVAPAYATSGGTSFSASTSSTAPQAISGSSLSITGKNRPIMIAVVAGPGSASSTIGLYFANTASTDAARIDLYRNGSAIGRISGAYNSIGTIGGNTLLFFDPTLTTSSVTYELYISSVNGAGTSQIGNAMLVAWSL